MCIYKKKYIYIYTTYFFSRIIFNCRGAKGVLLDKAVEIVAAFDRPTEDDAFTLDGRSTKRSLVTRGMLCTKWKDS